MPQTILSGVKYLLYRYCILEYEFQFKLIFWITPPSVCKQYGTLLSAYNSPLRQVYEEYRVDKNWITFSTKNLCTKLQRYTLATLITWALGKQDNRPTWFLGLHGFVHED